MTTLEVLRAARASIANPKERFKFVDWTSCTCGHIYAAATGKPAESTTEVTEAHAPAALDAFREIARVLKIEADDESGARRWTYAISNETLRWTAERADQDAPVSRDDALKVIDAAIAALEAEYERNRIDVLAQAKRIVDNAAPSEVPA